MGKQLSTEQTKASPERGVSAAELRSGRSRETPQKLRYDYAKQDADDEHKPPSGPVCLWLLRRAFVRLHV